MRMRINRRSLIAGIAGLALTRPLAARAADSAPALDAELRGRAKAALDHHRRSITAVDRIGIADFSAPSRLPRFHIVDVDSGHALTFLVAHGRGSDPAHSGWLSRFSNEPGSNASSAGAYHTGDAYVGQHGRSRRLIGLDPSNSNAEARAIVIHGAVYVGQSVIAMQGKLGRSEGCLALAPTDIDRVMDLLGPGRLIYADKV